MGKGRPRLAGKRGRNGRRVLAPAYDHGADHVIAHRARFRRFLDGKAEQQVYDPLGRAWAVGLLENDRIDPAVLRDAGRNYAARYWGEWPCSSGVSNYEGEHHREPSDKYGPIPEDPRGLMFGKLDKQLTKAGRSPYAAAQSLCLSYFWFPDGNPGWLDRLIEDRLRGKPSPKTGDTQMLCSAIEGLMALAGETESGRRAA